MGEIRRVALVTGATSGIGLAIARRLAGREYCVVVHSRSSAEAGNALAAELGDAHYIQADLADDTDRQRLVADSVRVAGIRFSGNESKVLMNDRVYRVNDVVDRTLNIRLQQVTADTLTFVDANGLTYVKNF